MAARNKPLFTCSPPHSTPTFFPSLHSSKVCSTVSAQIIIYILLILGASVQNYPAIYLFILLDWGLTLVELNEIVCCGFIRKIPEANRVPKVWYNIRYNYFAP